VIRDPKVFYATEMIIVLYHPRVAAAQPPSEVSSSPASSTSEPNENSISPADSAPEPNVDVSSVADRASKSNVDLSSVAGSTSEHNEDASNEDPSIAVDSASEHDEGPSNAADSASESEEYPFSHDDFPPEVQILWSSGEWVAQDCLMVPIRSSVSTGKHKPQLDETIIGFSLVFHDEDSSSPLPPVTSSVFNRDQILSTGSPLGVDARALVAEYKDNLDLNRCKSIGKGGCGEVFKYSTDKEGFVRHV
jgi:hypothetical protein